MLTRVLRPAAAVVNQQILKCHLSTPGLDLSKLDHVQVKLLEEVCILVDENDRQIGSASKKDCHLAENINNGMLHRAFSVFLFNDRNELLLQKRSSHKLTYPEHWTNTCCSHPLHMPHELAEEDAVGVRRAARRRLEYELGIDSRSVPLEAIDYINRIHYRAENVPANTPFAEHEIDYCLILRGDYQLDPNKNEIDAVKFVSMSEMKRILETEKIEGQRALLTPWFKLISKNFLFSWWSHLINLTPFKDHKRIYRL